MNPNDEAPITLDDVRALALAAGQAMADLRARADRAEALRNRLYEVMQRLGAGRLDVEDDDGADLGDVVLQRGGVTVIVDEPDKFRDWVAEDRPDEIVTTSDVRDSYRKAVLDAIKKRGQPVDADGNEIPGVTIKPRPPVLVITPTSTAYARAQAQLADSA